jgi:glutamate carboxypeptidase
MKILIITFLSLVLSTNLFADRDLERLKEIVNINSGTANINGVKKVQQKIEPWFKDLGFTITYKENPEGKETSAPLMIAEIKGQRPEFISFIMHADTVFEPSSPFQSWKMKSEKIMVGPGVMDNKGGIVVMARAMELYLQEKKEAKHSLRIIISPNEETGSSGLGEIFQNFGRDSWLVLGLEPADESGGIIEGRKGNVWYEIKAVGKEAHAGRNHRDGKNACQLLAGKIKELEALTDYKKEITVSTGRMEGGQDKYNIVCGWALAKIDVRMPSLQAQANIKKQIAQILKHPDISFKITEESPPFSVTQQSRPVLQKYLDTIKKVEGIRPQTKVSGGVGDSNQFSREGIIIMDGLGPVGGGAHTENEFVDITSIESRARILADFLKQL